MKKLSGKTTTLDLFYTLMTTVVLQFVLQLVIYPLTTRIYGEAVTGKILYFMSIVYIVPAALGTALNSTRLVVRKQYDVTNRDFLSYIIIFAAFAAAICGYFALSDTKSISFGIAYGVFAAIYVFRIFASVEFRLNSNFKGYFIYFCIISAGCLLGFGLFLLTDIWLFIFIIGESLALVYSVFKGEIFKNDGLSGNRKNIKKTLLTILASTAVRDCVNQLDRVILKITINEMVVTQYNAVSLISKTVQMLVQPINTLILSYLTVKGSNLSKKQLVKFTAIALACAALFYVLSIIGTPIFLKLFYSAIYDAVIQYSLIVNLGLIVGFVSTMFMSILLTQGKTGIQMIIQCVWGISYIAAAFYFTRKYQIWGLAYVALVANMLKLIVAIIAVLHDKKPKTAKA